MSNDEMNKYKALYSEYIGLVAELHNYQLVYIKRIGKRTAIDVRACIEKLINVEKRIMQATTYVYRENIQNINDGLKQAKIDEKAAKKAEIAYNKANPKKRGPKPKEKT